LFVSSQLMRECVCISRTVRVCVQSQIRVVSSSSISLSVLPNALDRVKIFTNSDTFVQAALHRLLLQFVIYTYLSYLFCTGALRDIFAAAL
jgi:uncharacterized membrane protein